MSGGGYSQQVERMPCYGRVEDLGAESWFSCFLMPVLPAPRGTLMVLLSRNPQKDFALCSASLISPLSGSTLDCVMCHCPFWARQW